MLVYPLIFSSILAHAAPDPALLKSVVEQQPGCQNSLRFDDENVYLGFGLYRERYEEPRHPIPGGVKVAPLSRPTEVTRLPTADGVVDTISAGGKLYALTFTAVEVFDLATRERVASVPTFAKAGPWAYMEHARGFARYKDTAVIAHGALGVSFFDLKTNRLRNQLPLLREQAPLLSAAMDVAVIGKYAYVVMDNLTVPSEGFGAFRGIVVIDLDAEKVVTTLNGMDPGADAITAVGDDLIVSFWGFPLWRYSTRDFNLRASQLPNPRARFWNFSIPGHPVGKPAVDAENYYTCYMHRADKPGEVARYHPQALPRRSLGF